MLTRWLTLTALLAGSVNPQKAGTGQDTLSVAPTCRVKGHPEVQLTLNCGDGKNAGVVQYWHTPFGELQSPSFQSKRNPVFMHHDGSLVIPNSSIHHSGLYYCLLQHTEGTTMWPYELDVGYNHQKNQEYDEYEQSSSCAGIRFSRDVGSEGEKQAHVSHQEFAGAVAASVLLTFVFGFSIGAVSRTHVLRCLGAVTKRLRLPRQQTDMVDSGSQFTMTTVPPMSQAFEMGQLQDDDSVNCASIDTTASSTASSPPAKPQRSFRNKQEERQETAAYLEGCDYKKEEERRMEEEETERTVEEKNKRCEEEEEGEEREGGGSQSETDDKKCNEDREEKDEGQSSKEKDYRQEEEEEADVQENESKEDGEQNRGSEEVAGSDKEKKREDEMKEEEEEEWRDEKEGNDEEKMKRKEDTYRDSQQSSTETEDDETDSKTPEDAMKNGIIGGGGGGEEALSSPPCPARRSRVIRLYQYDEDGQRYCHLPDPTPDDPGPVPRPRQRTVSLTRLNSIMAAASAGPLDKHETGREKKEDMTHFHMDL